MWANTPTATFDPAIHSYRYKAWHVFTPADAAFAAGFMLVLLTLWFITRSIVRRTPRSVDAWVEQTLLALHRVPVTGALYSASVVVFLHVRARLH